MRFDRSLLDYDIGMQYSNGQGSVKGVKIDSELFYAKYKKYPEDNDKGTWMFEIGPGAIYEIDGTLKDAILEAADIARNEVRIPVIKLVG